MLSFKKNCFKKIIHCFNKLKNIFSLFLFFLAYILYYLSLEKCYEGFDLCSLKTYWIEKKIIEIVISCIIIALLIELIFYRIISVLNLIHLSLFYITVFFESHGVDFEDHGYYNFFGSIAIIIILLLIFSPFNSLLYILI